MTGFFLRRSINKEGCILCSAYIFMAILFILYINAVLNDILTSDIKKIRHQNLWAIQTVAVSFNASKHSCHILMCHHFITPCELK